jgi:2-C-methyl-D-erythritol 2,4-cyclodiphosphate synthase
MDAPNLPFRIGLGIDIHPFVPGGPLWLGCTRIDHDHHLAGHSDGDAVAHAIADALLSAAGLGDLGTFLPATDPTIRGISGENVLKRVAAGLSWRGAAVVNIDCSVVCETPTLAPHLPRMIQATAAALGVDSSRVSIKPRHAEGLGFVGRAEGVAAQAVALVAVPT